VITETPGLGNSAATIWIRPGAPSLSLGLSESWKDRHLLGVFLRRDIKVRYKQTILGMGWAVLQPLLSVGVLTLVFGRVAGITTGGVRYPVFVLCGWAPWQLFVRGVTRSSNSLVENQFLVTYRVNFVMGDRRNDPRGISDVTVLIQDNDGTYSVLAVHEIIEKNDSPGR